jgi:hypothetical protein
MRSQLRSFYSFLVVFAIICMNQASAFETDLVGTTSSIGNGFTGGSHPAGSHFHSSNLDVLPAGNPSIIVPGAAEVGGFFGDEEIRGVSEFELQGAEAADAATLKFDVFDTFAAGLSPEASGVDGLFNQGGYVGFVDVFPYVADATETISDYQVETLTELPILSFEVGPGLLAGGDTLSVDVTQIYNDLVAGGEAAFGVRLQMASPDPDAGAITFDNFRISLEQSSTPVVPEPNAGVIMIAGCGMLLGLRRRRQS